jgi:hypothetical protein
VRRLPKTVGLVAATLTVRAWMGVWPAAVLVALAVVAAVVAGLGAFEDWVFDRGRRPGSRLGVMPVRGGGELGDHVAFARALVAVATVYLAECERQEREP